MNITGIAEIMDKSLDIFRKKFKDIIIYNFIYSMIIGFICLLVILLLSVVGIFIISSDGPTGILVYVFILFTLVFGLFLSLGSGFINIASKGVLEEKSSIGGSISLSFKSTIKTIALAFLVAISLIPAIIIFYLMGKGFISTMDSSFNYDFNSFRLQWLALIIIPLLLMVLMIFVALLYLTFYIYTLQEMVINKKGPLNAIQGSYRLIKNNFFKTLKHVFLTALSVYGIRYSFESIVTIIAAIIYLSGLIFGVKQDILNILTTTFGAMTFPLTVLTWLIVTPIFFITTTAMYYNERSKKEGLDIYMKLEALKNQRKEFTK